MSLASSQTRPGSSEAGVLEPRSRWMGIDWSAAQRWVKVGSQAVNVVELGEGPPLVFVHGLAGMWSNWLEQIPEFAAGHRVIAMDLPGFGHSPMPAERITISGYGRLLDGLFDALELDAAAVVGNSMGGFVGSELAIGFPQRVERLVLVAAAGISTYQMPLAMRTAPTLQRLERGLSAQTRWIAANAQTIARRRGLRLATLGGVARHPTRMSAEIAAEMLRGAGRPGFVQGLWANLEYDFRDRLAEIACPTLIVWGANDRVVPVRDSETYRQLIPNARKVVLEDTGHVPMIERPARFNQLLSEFLSE